MEKRKGRKDPKRKRCDRARNLAACLLARVIMNLYLAQERFRDRRHTTFLSCFACFLRILINENAIRAVMRSLFGGLYFTDAQICIHVTETRRNSSCDEIIY